jgi:anti-anti-sigma factor
MSRGTLSIHNHSRNGTFVGQEPVERRELVEGDIVSIPPYELTFLLRLAENADQGTSVSPLPTASQNGTVLLPAKTSRKALILEVVRGPAAIRDKQFELPAEGLTIGRSPNVDFCIDVPTLSRTHAEIRTQGEEWRLRDLGSANGTFVNGVRVSEERIRPGDEITLAEDVELRVTENTGLAEIGTPSRLRAFGRRRTAEPTSPTPPFLAQQPALIPRTTLPATGARSLSNVSADVRDESTFRKGAAEVASSRSFAVQSRRADWSRQVLILKLEGRVDGYNYTELGLALDRIIDNGERTVLVDGAKLTYVDHTGLGVLMKAVTAIERYGGRLWLIGANQRLLDSISLSHLDVFLKGKVYPDERAAQQELSKLKP